jgi:hypothetical protein
MCVGGHEESKPRVTVISWSADSIGPRIIAAPHRGHVHVGRVVVSVDVDPGTSRAGAGGAEEGDHGSRDGQPLPKVRRQLGLVTLREFVRS